MAAGNSRRRKERNRNVMILSIICLIIVIAIIGVALSMVNKKSGSKENSTTVSQSQTREDIKENITPEPTKTAAKTKAPTPTATPEPTPEVKASVAPDNVYSNYAYMERVSDGKVMFDKNGSAQMYPASMTKVMTALITIESLPDLDEQITITSDMIDPFYEQEASMAGFTAGENVTVRDILYGILLPSGADACAAAATRVAGSEAAFVELMNQKAEQLGLTGTHFSNCSGLHAQDHYMTCTDMAKLFEAALQNPVFKKIITAHDHTCAADEYNPEGLYFHSTMLTYLSSDTLANGAVIQGGKTGTTDEAGYCLASFATYKGETYVLVTSGAPFDDTGEHYNVADACTIYGALG